MNKMRLTILLLMLLSTGYAQKPIAAGPRLLPSEFIAGERFYLKMATVAGDTIRGFCDSGGGFTALFPPAIEKLHLQPMVKDMLQDSIKSSYILFRDVVKDKHFPTVALAPSSTVKEAFFSVPDKSFMQEEGSFLKILPQDAFLGQFFFMDKAWTFDYLKKQVWVNTPVLKKEIKNPHVQELGFKKDKDGKKLFAHPSMKIEVDGEVIDVLFDTGASFFLSANGKTGLNTTENSVGGSFIAKSVFDKWHEKHPDWKIIEKGDSRADIIEVPFIKIGNNIVGPVLFSKRPDEAWSVYMIESMDKVVKGAVGGSAFKYLRVMIDYNTELVKFESK